MVSGQKLAIIGYNVEIDAFISEMRVEFKSVRIFKGKENLRAQNREWIFPKVYYGQPQIEMVRLMTSGIYQFWKYWLHDRKYIETQLKENSAVQPQPLSLSSNLAFVFIILVFGLGTSFVLLNFEQLNRVRSRRKLGCNLVDRLVVLNPKIVLTFTGFRLEDLTSIYSISRRIFRDVGSRNQVAAMSLVEMSRSHSDFGIK